MCTTIQTKCRVSERSLPKWSNFPQVDENKTEFSNFMSCHFVENAPLSMKHNQYLILMGVFKVVSVTKEIKHDNLSELSHMKTDQLESDCWMIFDGRSYA